MSTVTKTIKWVLCIVSAVGGCVSNNKMQTIYTVGSLYHLIALLSDYCALCIIQLLYWLTTMLSVSSNYSIGQLLCLLYLLIALLADHCALCIL